MKLATLVHGGFVAMEQTMSSQTKRALAATVLAVSFGLASASAQDRAVATPKGDEDRVVQVEAAMVEGDESEAPIQFFPLPEGAVFERYTVFGEGGDQADVAAGVAQPPSAVAEQLVFSNTLGNFGAALGPNNLVSDDITTIVPGGCNLRRFEFPVVGKVNPAGTSGPYTINFALYSSCPGSVPTASIPSLIIPGTSGLRSIINECQNALDNDADGNVNDGCPAVGPEESGEQCANNTDDDSDGRINDGCPVVGSLELDADVPRLVSFVPLIDVPLPTNFWFGVKFSRNNAGIVFGSPPQVGFSCDQYDYPGSPCTAWAGGFPNQPHASFNLEIYADSACSNSFTGYKNNNPSGPTYNPGANVVFADDIDLGTSTCDMIAYEIAVKGVGDYTFDLRNTCDGGVIAGTERDFTVSGTTEARIARFTVDPPIPVPRNLFLSAKISAPSGGVVVAGQQACIGETADSFQVADEPGCTPIVYPPPLTGLPRRHAGFSAAITCAGVPPLGACCDMVFPQCLGGPDDGRPCCPPDTNLSPFCFSDPALTDRNPPCTLPGTCEFSCREVPQMNCPWPWPQYTSTDQPQWIEATSCDPDPFLVACGVSACCRPDDVCENLTLNQCVTVPPLGAQRVWQRGRYCEQPDQVCPINACFARTGDCTVAHDDSSCMNPACCDSVCRLDTYCCLVEWDRSCVERAGEVCHVAEHDECSAGTASLAALLVNADSSTFFTNSSASTAPSDPGFCCHPSGPGTKGFGTTWFKFVATDTSARFSTCNSDPHGDSLINVFGVDPSAAPDSECSNLVPLACVDDSDGCGAGTHGKLCVDDLTPGAAYYVVVASKTQEDQGAHQLEIRSPCFDRPAWSTDDCNNNGLTDGCDLGRKAAADCNANDLLDDCDLAAGTSFDCNQNGFLDECGGVVDSLKPTILTQGAGFGSSVAMDGNWLVVGSGMETTESIDRHTLHFFKKNAAGWDLRYTYELPVPPSYVAIKREMVLVKSDRDNMVYIFTCWEESCEPFGSFPGPAGTPCPRFGAPLGYDGDRAVVGIGICPDVPGSELAEVRVVDVWHYGWEEDARIPSPMTGVDDSFGAAVAIDHKAILIGAPAYHTGGPGAAYLYYKTQFGWELGTTFVPSDSRDHDLFGRAVALDGEVAIVGATLANGPTQAHTGAVYVFRRVWADWVQQAKLTVAPVTGNDLFGASVSLAGNILVVGAHYRNSAHVFRQIAGRWIEESQLTVNPLGGMDYFGRSVFTDGALIAVGAPATYSEYPLPDGRAFVFQPFVRDCNNNQVPDECDLRDNTSRDINYDGTPDECQQSPTPDADSDLDVDLKDFAAFMRCYTGAQPTFPQNECIMFDLPPDNDIDLSDLTSFVSRLTGPQSGNAPTPAAFSP